MKLTPLGWVMIRSPLLPFERWLSWTELASVDAELGSRERIEECVGDLREALSQEMTPVFLEALFFASPNLCSSLGPWMKDPKTRRGAATENSLVAFLSRMSARATPFGLCAGYTLGTISVETNVEFADLSQYVRHSAIDFRVVNRLSRILEALPPLKKELRFRANSTIYRLGETLRFLESSKGSTSKGTRRFKTISCEASYPLQQAVDSANTGATQQELSRRIAGSDDLLGEAALFAEDLISSQILVSDLDIPISGPDPAAELTRRVLNMDSANVVAKEVEEIRRQLSSLDAAPIGTALSGYEEISKRLQALCATSLDTGKNLLHADLRKSAKVAEVGSEVIEQITKAVELLHSLSGPSTSNWSRFKQDFLERFGEADVPLPLALDEELGIPFSTASNYTGSDLLEGLLLQPSKDEEIAWTSRDAQLFRIVQQALVEGKTEISLSAGQLELLRKQTSGPLLNSFSVMATIIAESCQAVNEGKYQVLLQGYSCSAAMYGRFCSADPELNQRVREMLAAEEAADQQVVFAEVVHYPAGEELGNIVCRPDFSYYEIPFVGGSSLRPERQIPITDLTVSVRNDRVVLHSKLLQKQVIPRLSIAHLFTKPVNSPLYQFLCGLRFQALVDGPTWKWGTIFRSSPFLPRLVHGRIVISPATWRLAKEEIATLVQETDREEIGAIQRFCCARKIPRFAVLKEGDQHLPIDFRNPLSVRMFIHLTKKREEVILNELLPGPGQLMMRGPEGHFNHEIVIPFFAGQPAPNLHGESKEISLPARLAPIVERKHLPGTRWLYAKIYSGPSFLEKALVDTIGPLIRELATESKIQQWFFIRYQDPYHHLRIRMKLSDSLHFGEIMSRLQKSLHPLLENGTLHKLQVDTYEREIERYGGIEGISLAEQAFHLDSEAALAVLGVLQESGPQNRVKWVAAGLDALLIDFGESLEYRLRMMDLMREDFRREFQVTAVQRHAIAEKFRQLRKPLLRILEGNSPPIFEKRSVEMRVVASALRQLAERGLLARPLDSIVASFVHLHVNRMFKAAHRQHELVIYDLLCRAYDSMMSLSKQTFPGELGVEHDTSL